MSSPPVPRPAVSHNPGHSPTLSAARRPYSAGAEAVRHSGDPSAAEALVRAMTVPNLPDTLSPEETGAVEEALSMHLFHSFAARTHPLTVRHLLADAEVGPEQLVLDPFVGSGTVLVEAALRGARGVGLDVGPLQVRLSRFKATPMPAGMRANLERRTEEVVAASLERVRARQSPGRTWDQLRYYEPHIYLETCGLREEIERVRVSDPPLGEALLLVLSSLIIKLSRQRAETRNEEVRRSLGKGQASRWLRDKTAELLRLLAAFESRVPQKTPRPLVLQGDARHGLPAHTGLVGKIDVVLTSPPYLGVYDYTEHHARRAAWLGLDQGPLLAAEIGARRQGPSASPAELLRGYTGDTEAWVQAAAQALRPGGRFYVVIGDASLPGLSPEQAAGDTPLREAAGRAGLHFVAACSVLRPALPGQTPRREHLLHFVSEGPAGC